MARYKTDYVDIDPDNCSLEELRQKIEELELLSSYFETKQLAIKTFINSVYGATASKYFVGHNTNVAESITLQGQDLNHFSENAVNTYFSGLFQSREEYDKEIYVPIFDYAYRWPLDNAQFYAKDKNKNWVLINLPCSLEDIKTKNISEETEKTLKKHVFVKTTFGEYLNVPYDLVKAFDIDHGRITHQLPLTHESFWVLKDIKDPETGEVIKKEKVHIFNYLEGDKSMTIAGDTDSVDGKTQIYFDNSKIAIEDAFNQCKLANFDIVLKLQNGNEVVPVTDHTTKTVVESDIHTAVNRPIKYIMRHKVSKERFKIKSKSGKEVIVTGDHSCMVYRDGKLISVKAKDINIKTDKLVEINE